jgi:hypothetical protein
VGQETQKAPSRAKTPFAWKVGAVFVSLLAAFAAGEGLVRWSLFHATASFATKDPRYYARTPDELWTYRYLFAGPRDESMARIGQAESATDSEIPFYRQWAASLEPDAQLGYVRKSGFRLPCHETTNLGTRGLHDYRVEGPKILFFGDSFVESAACSDDTLPAKVERATGIDTPNYGVGGYGLDQMLLSVERVRKTFDRSDCLFLVGLIADDLDRVLLTVRSSAKPYFTLADGHLVLHTGHIHPASLTDAFERPPARSYLLDFLIGRFGEPVYVTRTRATRVERRARIEALTAALLDRVVATQHPDGPRFAFVILPQPGRAFDPVAIEQMHARHLPVLDLQDCMDGSGQPDTALYRELHPTSLGNDLLARCLVDGLDALHLVPRGGS